MRAEHMTPREREERDKTEKQEASMYEWLQNCVMKRMSLTAEQSRAIYYHVRRTRVVLLIDSRQHAGGRPLYGQDKEPLDKDEPAFSITSPALPYFALSTHDSLKEAFDFAISIGLKPVIHVYSLSDKKQ